MLRRPSAGLSLVGDNVLLRVLGPLDAAHADVVRWRRDDRVRHYFFDQRKISARSYQRWFGAMWTRGEDWYFLIHDREGRPLGTIGLYDLDRRHRSAQLGRFLIDPDYQGQGYGRDALLTLLYFALHREGLNLHRVWLETWELAPAAIYLYEWAGFVKEGTLTQSRRQGRIWYDSYLYGLLSADFLLRYPSLRPEMEAPRAGEP